MIYLFKHIVVRTKKDVNDAYKFFFDDDYYNSSDYNGEELISEHDDCVKIYDDSFEIHINDGTNECDVFDFKKYKYRVEWWQMKNDEWVKCAIDNSDEVLDPERYSEYCKQNGDEIRIYSNYSGKLIDSYRYEISGIEEIANKIETALNKSFSNKTNIMTR